MREPMQSPGREPSMEDILASIKKVIAEEKELRTAVAAGSIDDSPLPEDIPASDEDTDVLELNEPPPPPRALGPPLLDEEIAGHSREALSQLQTVAASVP